MNSLESLRGIEVVCIESGKRLIFQRFIRSFSEGLRPDCDKFGITVQRLTPSLVKSKLNLFTKRLFGFDNYLVPNAEMYASAAVSTLGRSSVTCGFWPHELQVRELDSPFFAGERETGGGVCGDSIYTCFEFAVFRGEFIAAGVERSC